MFLNNWKKNTDLHPSPEATLWTAAIRVLGCVFVLQVQIRTSAKAILKNEMKDLKYQGKNLTFDIACVPTKTKTDRFLTGKTTHQPFSKRQCVPKQFTKQCQSFYEVTICVNMFGVMKYPLFVQQFRDMMTDIMQFEPHLVIILYPDKDHAKKVLPFANDCFMLFSSYRCQIYIESLYIAEGRPTTVKILVCHGMPPVTFNLKECAQVAYKRDGVVCVCTIQDSKVVEAGYLQGSTNRINDHHWTDHCNLYPHFKRTDVQVKTKKVEDPAEEGGAKYKSQNQIFAAHIYCAEKDEQEVNIQMSNLYNKNRISSKAAANLQEARAMGYVPYKSTYKIAQTNKRIVKLQKNQLMQKWRLE